MGATLQDIFRSAFSQYQSRHGLSKEQYKAANAIMHCGREEMGYEEWICPSDGYIERQYHSCRHRSCPRCNGKKRQEWLEKEQERLLPCDHYHVVLTLPHELNAIWQYNRAWCADRLLRAGSETLQELLADEKYLGGKIGILAALHTWGRTLSFHPHVHLLVTGSGMKGEKPVHVKKDFLLPVAVIKAKFRGKWLTWLNRGYATGEIRLPDDLTDRDWRKLLTRISRKAWNVRIEGAYRHGRGVAVYLARYMRGGPIRNDRLIEASSGRVRFRYLDYLDEKTKSMELATDHFLSRILWHIPPEGLHTVRHYGLYSSGGRRSREKLRKILGEDEMPRVKEGQKPSKLDGKCPKCGRPLVRGTTWHPGISYIRNRLVPTAYVQQDVQADRDRLWCQPP